MNHPLFQSLDPQFRSPVGAVSTGTNVHFRINLPRSLGCTAASLLMRFDSDAGTKVYSMFWCGMDGDDHEWWECDAKPEQTGLYWYSFTISTNSGIQNILRGPGGEGTLSGYQYYQLTVYDPVLKTPDWLVGGVIYQIFPDRFFRAETDSTPLPDRQLHNDWYEVPEWKPNAAGKITNSDFFGGNLAGITQKLDFLATLGVTCLYLNPIFEAFSNHRYDTADYQTIDPLLGTEGDLRTLCEEATRRGIRVLLDGVFNHTGSDSRYFNREERYDTLGAYQSKESPWFSWYDFNRWPDRYSSWWGFETLPSIRHDSQDFHAFIAGENGILKKWMRTGVSGWRLDVVDELPDSLLDKIRTAVKSVNKDGLIIGEVWEDASNKESYGHRRRYLLGNQLDSVMNYPFRTAILHFLRERDASPLRETVLSILENYPPQITRLLMNHIGTHDTERILTALAGEPSNGRGRDWQASHSLAPDARERGLRLLRVASALQYTLPGVPSVYYGDEVGMEGYADPFNRACYPWGREDAACLEWYRFLGKLRRETSCLREGMFTPIASPNPLFAFCRSDDTDRLLCAFSSADSSTTLEIGAEWDNADVLCGNAPQNGALLLERESCALLRLSTSKSE